MKILVALFLIAIISCGPSSQQKALSDTLLAINSARDGFETWDLDHEALIVKSAPSKEDAEKNLLMYHDHRQMVVDAFSVAYQALAIAALKPSDATMADAETKLKALLLTLEDLRKEL